MTDFQLFVFRSSYFNVESFVCLNMFSLRLLKLRIFGNLSEEIKLTELSLKINIEYEYINI